MIKNDKKAYMAIFITMLFLISAIVPTALSKNATNTKGFDKGPSYLPVVPIQKTTMVMFDEESYFDDYSYLAAVPGSVFKEEDTLYSNPLLYFQEEVEYESEAKRPLNAGEGITYFMEDWMSYSDSKLDQMTLVNVPRSKISRDWDAKNYKIIDSYDITEVASELALSEWSSSNDAVLAVIDDEFEEYENETSGEITGTLEIKKDIETEHFEMPQTNKLNPQFEEFEINDGYVYVQARAWYACIETSLGLPVPGFENFMTVTIPSGDKDLQLYCQHEGEWMQVEAAAEWNAKAGMDEEYARSYVYNSGNWRVGLTDVPTKGGITRYGSAGEILNNLVKGVTYNVDVEMYPGEIIPFDIKPEFFSRDVQFELECPNDDVEFILIGPSGEEIKEAENGLINLSLIGECPEGKTYKFGLFTESGEKGVYDYTIKYRWTQRKEKEDAEYLTDATEGAVLASMLNAPMLYINKGELSDATKEALLKLGVENIYLVDVGSHIGKENMDYLDFNYNVEVCDDLEDIYDDIREISGGNDVIFSTIDPWTEWETSEKIRELGPDNETKASLFIGPAAYLAAHHGSPVLIVENHPELSSSIVWHNELWRENPNGFTELPAVAEMYLTGKTVYEFLDLHGFDHQGWETIITVAGQYDIGASWDRVFVGKATSGRFTFSPVDCAYWIPRDIFYPALIFENPAMNPRGNTLINGSESTRTILGTLKVTKPSGPETYNYPVLHSYVSSFIHRFNERASKYWGAPYECADGIIPGITHTFEPIDDGVNLKYTGEEGSFWPDLTESENVPFYTGKGGYGNVYSTAFDPIMENLNSGVLLWMMGSHGWSGTHGAFIFHDPNFLLRKETNPWRGYEPYLGFTEEPDTMTTSIHGINAWLLGNPTEEGLGGNGVMRLTFDFFPSKMPIRDLLGKISSLPVLSFFTPDWFEDTQDYYDGIVGSALFSKLGTVEYGGMDVDEKLENIHSCGLITAACLPAYKYLHVSMIRHGCSYQVMDPWGTSWYSSFWEATIPRDIVLGDTVGEAYVKGISHVGILYLGGAGPNGEEPQWWWDIMENVCYFGDPDLRMYVPSTKYSDDNYWEKEDTAALSYSMDTNINGHMPYGATGYPNEREEKPVFDMFILVIIAVILVVVILVAVFAKKPKKAKTSKKTKKSKQKKTAKKKKSKK